MQVPAQAAVGAASRMIDPTVKVEKLRR